MKKTRVLIDMGIVMTHLGLIREYGDACKRIMFLCGDGSIEGCMTAQMFSDLQEKIVARTDDPANVTEIFDKLLCFIKILPVGERELREAYIKEPNILKDTIAAAAAKYANCSWIITQEPSEYDYDLFGIPVVEPEEFIEIYQKEVRKA